MIDNMGKRKATLEDCDALPDGIHATGQNPKIVIENRDPLVIDNYILGNDNDYVVVSFEGTAPSIKQVAYDGSVVTHEMVSIVPDDKKVTIDIKPSPNSDLQEFGGNTAYLGDDLSKSGTLMVITRKEKRALGANNKMLETNIIYLLIQGHAIEIANSVYDETVLGTGNTIIEINLSSDTIIKSFASGNRVFNAPTVSVRDTSFRESEEDKTVISKKIEEEDARSSIKGFTQKLTKMFNINGGL